MKCEKHDDVCIISIPTLRAVAMCTFLLAVVWFGWMMNVSSQLGYSFLDNHQHTANSQIYNRRSHLTENRGLFDYLANFKNPCWREEATDRLRCLPYFYQLGVTKCGTTTLFGQLIKHPDIAPPKRKEFFFWGNAFNTNRFSSYLDKFAEATTLINKSVDEKGWHGKITFEATPSYFADFNNIQPKQGSMKNGEPFYTRPHMLHAVNAGTKFVVILKNPVDRLYSEYYHFFHETASARKFHQLVVNGIRMMSDCLAARTLRSCICDKELNKRVAQNKKITINFSMYYPYAKEWLAVFPRKQIMFIKGEEFYADPVRILKEIFHFLEIDDLGEAEYRDIQTTVTRNFAHRKKERMLPETRRVLEDFLRPYNKMLAELLHDKKFDFF